VHRVSGAAELQQVKTGEGKNFARRSLWRSPTTKRKKPGSAGLFDELLF
jgi:hypothetical protein